MFQEYAVYVIVALALFFAVRSLFGARVAKKQPGCGDCTGCSGCELKSLKISKFRK